MNRSSKPALIFLAMILLCPSLVQAETLAMLNYESKKGNPIRQEGISVIDVDPNSSTYGQTLMDIPPSSQSCRASHLLQQGRDQGLCHCAREK